MSPGMAPSAVGSPSLELGSRILSDGASETTLISGERRAMTEGTPHVPAGWFVDPDDSDQLRWWDGSAWTSHYAPLVVEGVPVKQAVSVSAVDDAALESTTASGVPVRGQPAFAEEPVWRGASGQSTVGQSTFGQSSYGRADSGQSGFGQSSYGQSSFGQSSYGQSSYAQPAFGQAGYGFAMRPVTAAPPLNFGESIASVLRKYADFTGVASRSEYWWWYLFTTAVSTVFYIVMSASEYLTTDVGVTLLIAIVALVWALATFLPTLAVTVRRLRDTGRSWVFLLLWFVPFGTIVLLFFFCQASTGYKGDGVR